MSAMFLPISEKIGLTLLIKGYFLRAVITQFSIFTENHFRSRTFSRHSATITNPTLSKGRGS